MRRVGLRIWRASEASRPKSSSQPRPFSIPETPPLGGARLTHFTIGEADLDLTIEDLSDRYELDPKLWRTHDDLKLRDPLSRPGGYGVASPSPIGDSMRAAAGRPRAWSRRCSASGWALG